jgi:hypothetical protein
VPQSINDTAAILFAGSNESPMVNDPDTPRL